MSDWQRPEESGSGDDPVDPGVAAPTVTLETTGEVRNQGIRARVVAAVVGVVLLVGGVGFAATQLGGDDRTPEQAVDEFFAAISSEDILGVLATLDPGERDALADPVRDLFDELERLEVLEDGFDPSGVRGIDLEFEDLAFHTEAVRKDLVRVYLVGGRVSYAIDSDELAIGDFVTDTLDRFGVDHTGFQETDTTVLGGTLDEFLAVRNGSEGWRVSIGYTAAEAARIDANLPPPDPALALAPIGADSPEAAVEGLARAAAALDVPGIVARLSPSEMRALQEYWPLFGEEASLVDAATLGVEVDVGSLDLRSETDGDRARVYLDGFVIAVTAEGSRLEVTYADGCISYAGDLAALEMASMGDEPFCTDDIDRLFEQSFGAGGFEEMGIEVPAFDPMRTPDSYVVVDRVGGRWYVAPVSSAAHAVVEGLRAIDRSHLDALVELVESFFTVFMDPMATEFESSGRLIVPGTELTEPEFIDPGYLEPQYIEPDYAEPQYIEPDYAEPQYVEPEYVEPEPDKTSEPSGG